MYYQHNVILDKKELEIDRKLIKIIECRYDSNVLVSHNKIVSLLMILYLTFKIIRMKYKTWLNMFYGEICFGHPDSGNEKYEK